MIQHFEEKLDEDSFSFRLDITKVLHECQTDYQKIMIFENPTFGRVLVLDSIIQTTQYDEHIYHEMFVHQPLLTHPDPKNVLIIGGGDGGLLREVIKYPSVETVTMVEIDSMVIELCKQHMPTLSDGSFDDPRLRLVVQDAMTFITTCQQSFDVILSDTSDPVGPNEPLFSDDFYQHCQRCLSTQGIFVAQNGVSFTQIDEIVTTYERLKPYFNHPTFYRAEVPSYIGGSMCFAWCQMDSCLSPSLDDIKQRYHAIDLDKKTRHFDPELYMAARVLPKTIRNSLSMFQNAGGVYH